MNCRNCGELLPANSTARRAFCSDLCRVQHNRASKANDLYFDAVVAIRKLKKASQFDDLRNLQLEIGDSVGTVTQQLSSASRSSEVAALVSESVKISHSLRVLANELKVNRSNRLLERLLEVSDENSRIIREIAELVANS